MKILRKGNQIVLEIDDESKPNFNIDEIEFMKKLGLNLDFSNLSDDDCIQIVDTVGDKLVSAVQDSPLQATKEIIMCENIISELE